MLEKPDLPNERLAACLQDGYGLRLVDVNFLPLGADRNTAVYRVVAVDGTPCFVKLRSGAFDELSVALPKFLHDQGIRQVIAPRTAHTGQLWVSLDVFKVIVYPFIEGRNGYEVDLSDRHWGEFGAALKRIHTVEVPPALLRRLRRESYSPQGRESVKTFLGQAEGTEFNDPVAGELAAFLKEKRPAILDLVGRADRLARALQARSPELVLCHSDVHAGNVLVDANDAFYIVDWDDPILAPKERDLMFVGGGQGFGGHTLQEEETLFYEAYGPVQIDPFALAYYRYERIVQDLAAFCEQIFLTNAHGEDRVQALVFLKSNFLTHNTIEIAYASDKTQGTHHFWE